MHTYVLPELDYGYSALEPYIPARALELHHLKHHAAYVAGANATISQLSRAREQSDFTAINQLEKSLAFHLSGHVLHSMFWRNLRPDGGGRPEHELLAAVEEHFGNFRAMQAQVNAAAMNIQGSGWAALCWDSIGERLLVEQIHDHQGNSEQGGIPLLVVDMWEHAYYLKYENRKGEWIDAFWNLVNWADVEARFTHARRLDLALLSPSH